MGRLAASALAALIFTGCPQAITPDPDAGVDAGFVLPPADASVAVDAGDPPDACVPWTCAEVPSTCGEVGDGCGGPMVCGCDVARTCSAMPGGEGGCDCPDSAFLARVADSGGGFTGLFNSLALDAHEGIHLAYVNGNDGFKYLHQPARTQAFAPVIEVVDEGKPVTGTSLAVDAAGAVHVVYYRWTAQSSNIWDAEVWYARRAPEGGWTRARVVTAGEMVYARADYAAIALAPSGTIHLLYYTFNYQQANLWHARSDTGTGWVTELVAEGTPIGSNWSYAGTVSLERDTQGTLHALYFDYAAFTLRHARRPSAGVWVQEPAPVAAPRTASERAGAASSLAIAPDGVLHATFTTDVPGETLLWHATSGGGGWQTQRVDPLTGTARVGQYNALVADRLGGLHVVYRDSADFDLKYAHQPAGGSWSAMTAVSAGQVGSHAALAVDEHGSLHAAFFELVSQSNGTGQLRYATRCR